MTRGDRDRRKKNPDRVAAARKRAADLERELIAAEQKPNKTPGDKERLERLKKQVAHHRKTGHSKSETHARKAKRH